MTTAKDLFQKQQDLRNWWAQVVDDPRYCMVLLHARSAFLEGKPPNMDYVEGGSEFARILAELPAADDLGSSMLDQANPGLHHDLDKPEPKED